MLENIVQKETIRPTGRGYFIRKFSGLLTAASLLFSPYQGKAQDILRDIPPVVLVQQHPEPDQLSSVEAAVQKAERYITSHQKGWKEEYKQFLRIPTISGAGEQEEDKVQAVKFLIELAHKKGFSAQQFTITYTKEDGLTKGSYPVFYLEVLGDHNGPTILFGTHYDVRPPNDSPQKKWNSDPFIPLEKKVQELFAGKQITDTRIYARGAGDSKGHILAILNALETWKNVYGLFPATTKLFLEGNEEKNSGGIREFIQRNPPLFKADVVVLADTPTLRAGIPFLIEGLRGYLAGEFIITTASDPVHSGLGSYVPNAVELGAHLIDLLQDPFTGKAKFPEFYQGMKEPNAELRKKVQQQYQHSPEASEETVKKHLGLKNTVGDTQYNPAERTTILPSFDVHQMEGGGEGMTPEVAVIRYSVRLVEGQDPFLVERGINRVIQESGITDYATVTIKKTDGAKVFFSRPERHYQAAMEKVLTAVFGAQEVDRVLDGASEPIASMYDEFVTKNVLFIGFGHPNDNPHVPNESMLWNYGVLLGTRVTVGIIYQFSQIPKGRN